MIRFEVAGQPATKGSFRAIVTRGKTAAGRPKAIAKNDNPRCDAWQEAVGWAAKAAMRGAAPIAGSVTLDVVFRFARPKRLDRAGRYDGPMLDIDKLQRALFDGMSGIAFVDDAQIVHVHVRKEWGPPGVAVTVLELPAIGATP